MGELTRRRMKERAEAAEKTFVRGVVAWSPQM